MSKKKIHKIAAEKAFDYQRELRMIDSVSDDHIIARRMGFYDGFIAGAEWKKDEILKLIETRISEIIGDAQPNPVLRIELQSIIDKIK